MNELRPRTFDDCIGQEETKKLLRIACSTAKNRHEPMDHVLLYGFPGLGKTTLAQALANEMEVNIKIVEAPSIKKAADLTSTLLSLDENDILFIDEIHALPKQIEELLYSALEDRETVVTIRKMFVRMKVEPFTLVGATTRLDLISQPLRDRFGMICHLQYYSIPELERIIFKSAKILNVSISKEALNKIAACSRGTARVANQVLKRCRDLAEYHSTHITTKIVEETLALLNIEDNGFTDVDRKIISVLKNSSRALGINTLASLVGVNPESLLTVYEPYLLKEGIIEITQKGRVLL